MSDSSGQITQGYPVLRKHVPFIIGREGRNIDAISKACGATLSIDRTDDAGVTFNREWAYVRITGLGYQVDRAKKLLLINTIEATQQEARNGDFGGRGERSNNGGGGHDGDDGNSGANQPRRNRNRNGNTGNNGNNGNNNNGNENSGNGGRGRRSPGRGRGRGRDRQPRQ